MQSVRPSRILVSGKEPSTVEEVRRLLAADGHDVRTHRIGTPGPDDLHACRLAVVEATGCQEECLRWCRLLRAHPAEAFLPVLFITEDVSPPARLASFEAGADTYLLRPFAPDELRAQVRAFLRIRDVHDRLADKTAEV